MTEYLDLAIKFTVFATQCTVFATAFLLYNRKKTPNNILKKYQLDEHFSVSQDILNNDAWRRTHDLVLEMWFFGSSGKRLSAGELRFFLANPTPLKNLIDYLNCQTKLSPARGPNGEIIGFRSKTEESLFKKIFLHPTFQNSLFFFSLMYIALSVAFAPTLYKFDPAVMTLVLMYALPIAFLAWLSGAQVSELESAKRIISQFQI